jgi:hypothetical protein
MSSLVSELSDLISAFNERGIEHAVCGGLAIAIHGVVRATVDIDLLIRPESLADAVDTAATLGYDIRGTDISFKERAVEIRRVSKIDEDGEDLSLDLMLVTESFEGVWLSRESIDYSGNNLCVVSRDGLIEMKRLAGRPRDLADIERLENEEG